MKTTDNPGFKQRICDLLKRFLRTFVNVISRNLGWKIFSLLAAVLLWSYLISSDPTITRDKTISGVEITTSGLSVLNSRELALLTDPAALPGDIRVRVSVPQAEYSRVSADTVRVELDLSQIRQTGRQEVELIGISNYGEVIQVIPSRIEIVIEKLDTRTVPVNVQLTGKTDDSGYWYTVSRTNPVSINVSGPSSLVAQVSSAYVTVDVTGLTQNYTWSAPVTLRDRSGASLPQILTKSSSSVAVGVSTYPIKEVAVSASIDTATVGVMPEGYSISHIKVQPDIITVAASEELLEELDELTFTPIDISDRRQSFSVVCPINSMGSIQHLSSEEVTVTVYVEELDITRTYRSIAVGVTGRRDSNRLTLGKQWVDIKLTGPYSSFEEIAREDIIAQVDVTGLEPGTYKLPIKVTIDNHPEFSYVVDPPEISVTVID